MGRMLISTHGQQHACCRSHGRDGAIHARPRARHCRLGSRLASPIHAQTGSDPPSSAPESAAETAARQARVWRGGPQFSRRLLLGGSTATALALGANFSGVTSAILSFFPDTARSLRLDTIYPIQGFQRWRDEAAGFELVFPSAWSADLSVRRRLAEDASWQRPSPGLPPLGLAPRPSRGPVVAFGPRGTTGEENISVIVSRVGPGSSDSAQSLFPDEEGAQAFLDRVVARPSAGITAALRSLRTRTDGAGRVYTTMDFLVSSPRWQRANLSTYVMSGQSLYTLNCQCSAQNASDRARMFQVVTDNFAVAPRAPGQ